MNTRHPSCLRLYRAWAGAYTRRMEGQKRFCGGVPLMLVALLACGVLTAPSLAAEPLPVTSVSPADGATIPLPSGPVPFELVSPSPERLWNVNVEVSTQNIPGQDGSLADDFKKDFFSLFQSDAYPTIYRGQSGYVGGGYWWDSTPGTYYWQIHATTMSPLAEYLSPVYTLTITAPAPPPTSPAPPQTPPATSVEAAPTITIVEAYAAVKEIIRKQTGRSAHHLSDKCRRTSQSEATCKAAWSSAARLSSSTLLYAGSFYLSREPQGNYFSFQGLRERYGCAKRYGTKHCASQVRWR